MLEKKRREVVQTKEVRLGHRSRRRSLRSRRRSACTSCRSSAPLAPLPLHRHHGHHHRHCRRHRRRHRRRCHLHLLHLPPRPLSPSPWLLARRQASPAFPPRPLSPPAASVRAPCLPGPRQVRRWRRSRSPPRELPQDCGCLSRVAHMTLLRCSPLAGCGCVIELGSRKPGWRLTSRKIRSGRLPQFGSPPQWS